MGEHHLIRRAAEPFAGHVHNMAKQSGGQRLRGIPRPVHEHRHGVTDPSFELSDNPAGLRLPPAFSRLANQERAVGLDKEH